MNLFNETQTLARECVINLCQYWKEFISDSCYYLSCKDGKNWLDEDGKKQTFNEWMEIDNHRRKEEYIFDSSRFNDNVIITLYDTVKQKRLILDGQHRASAITIAYEKGVSMPEVRVLECYGSAVSVIFSCDVYQL
jgi:hypothetical protein